MSEERDAAARQEGPTPERYYAQLVSGGDGVTVTRLQEAMNEGARQSWRLVGVVNEPGGQGIILVWDQQGFISG
jgi:hypothetical protein